MSRSFICANKTSKYEDLYNNPMIQKVENKGFRANYDANGVRSFKKTAIGVSIVIGLTN